MVRPLVCGWELVRAQPLRPRGTVPGVPPHPGGGGRYAEILQTTVDGWSATASTAPSLRQRVPGGGVRRVSAGRGKAVAASVIRNDGPAPRTDRTAVSVPGRRARKATVTVQRCRGARRRGVHRWLTIEKTRAWGADRPTPRSATAAGSWLAMATANSCG